ncbi:MAG TPA: hypothetical protein VF545_05700 [Thermoleophilaceae bacterium]|jgi:hypothetical protein
MAAYRDRLRLEGLALAAFGLAAAALVVALEPSATRGPGSTAAQLVLVLLAMVFLGAAATRRAMASAVELGPAPDGSGQPTALWKLPPIVAGLTVGFGELAGWDAGLRAAGGCAVVGLVQGTVLERLVAADERRGGWRYHRVPGSRILRGTRLGRSRPG